MAFQRKWLQSTDLRQDDQTGAILVASVPTQAPVDSSFDLLGFPLYHTEGIEDCTWDVQYALHPLTDTDFDSPILAGDTSVSFEGLLARVDYRGVPGTIAPVTAAGIATRMSEADGQLRSGLLLVPLDAVLLGGLAAGAKYIRRSRQKARGHDEWSVHHDEIFTW
jgi:hypothetical protein